MQLDKKDYQIIAALQNDARQSLAALGRKIGLSQPAISERVKKLEDHQIITGYAAKINLKALGLNIQTVIRIRTTHEYIQYYVEKFEKTNQVIDAVRVTGEDCFIVQCAFTSTTELEKIVDDFAIHGAVSTSLVLSHPVSKSLKFN